METQEFASEWRYTSSKTESCEADDGDKFSVEDLLDFSKEDDENLESFTFTGNSNDSSPVVAGGGAIDSCNSSFCNNATEPHFSGVSDAHFDFSGELCIPSDDLEELEWLSKFVEEDSFSNEDPHKLDLISGLTTFSSPEPSRTRPDLTCSQQRGFHSDNNTKNPSHPIFNVTVSVPAKARSKRAWAAPCNWASQLLALSTTSRLTLLNTPHPENPSSPNLSPAPKPKKRRGRGEAVVEANGAVRRCMHCNTEKTPQWRTGPMGPKTLCNACGVRYKSGRLVPEYRPAASPTFVLAKHSNSHRKVMELRRKKETNMKQQLQANQQQQKSLLSTEFIRNGIILQVQNQNEYLIHQCVGQDFRQLI